jgi:hypothetical protein
MEKCPNALCAYRTTHKGECTLCLTGITVKGCICYQAFVKFSKTIEKDITVEFDSETYLKWIEIQDGNFVKALKGEKKVK